MKLERFIKEYASFQKMAITSNELMQDKYKEKAIINIDNALKAKERGLLTVDETIKSILQCLQ